MRQHKKENSQM